MVRKKRCTAIVLAAGSGSRMNSPVAKQFLELNGKPLIWYSLHALEESAVVDDCILVTGEADLSYVREKIVEAYRFTKVRAVIPGGAERYLSVENGLEAIWEDERFAPSRDGFVFIHDGARPFLTEKLLSGLYEAAERFRACVAAVHSKDTIKLADKDGFVADTPDRSLVWSVQTPQVFETKLAVFAYREFRRARESGEGTLSVTDDAGVVERFTNQRVALVEASYRNIKITTPEDLLVAEAFLSEIQAEAQHE